MTKQLNIILLFLYNSYKQKDKFNLFHQLHVIYQYLLRKKIIKYKYKKFNIYINNDSLNSITYHIIHSTPKIEKMVDQINECNIAIDIGANNGLFTYFLKKKFPNAKVYLFEPSNNLINIIKLNLKNLDNIIIENKAVSDIDGKLLFYINSKSEQTNSISKENVLKGNITALNNNIKEIEVTSISLDNYFKAIKEDIDVLKVDIQGAEYKMIIGAKNTIKRVKIAFFEISFLDNYFFETFSELRVFFPNYRIINEVKMGADIMFFK